jgi:hypothetical protein
MARLSNLSSIKINGIQKLDYFWFFEVKESKEEGKGSLPLFIPPFKALISFNPSGVKWFLFCIINAILHQSI